MWGGGRLLSATSHTVYMLAAAPGDVGPLSSLHVSDRRVWWWPRLAVKTTAVW